MARFVLTKKQAGWNQRSTLAATNGVKLINYSIKPNRNPTKEEGLHTMSHTFIAGGVFNMSGSLEGYYRCDSGVGDVIFAAIFGSKFATGADHVFYGGKELPYGSVQTDGNKPIFTVADNNGYTYYIGNEIFPYTMRLVEDGPADGVTHFNEFKNTLFQNLTLTFDTREFPKFKVDFLAGPSRNKYDDNGAVPPVLTETDVKEPTFNNSKPAAFYNAVIEICPDSSVTTPVWTGIGCKSFSISIARKIDENYVYIGSPFLAGAALNGVSEVSGNFTTGAGLTEYNMFDSVFHDASNDSTDKFAAGELLQDTNALKTYEMRVALFDTDFKMIGFFVTGTAALTEGSKNIQGRQVIERTINFQCFGPEGSMYFYVPAIPLVGSGGTLNDPPQTFKGLSASYNELN